MHEVLIRLGRFSREYLDRLLRESFSLSDTGARIAFLSEQFLEIPYQDSTLTGDSDTSESLVINLEGVDCMTFIEYVQAMNRSSSCDEFISNVRNVRYRSRIVDFTHRNHFFTDWIEFNADLVRDFTSDIGRTKTIKTSKALNRKPDGTRFLPGIDVIEREIYYIPSADIGEEVRKELATGDYVGIYSEKSGLDVSHTGIVIRREDSVLLRHASSREGIRKVVDEDFTEYIMQTPGIIVLRDI